MSIRVFEDVGAAKKNSSLKIGRVESVGPVAVVAANLSAASNVVVSFARERTGTPIYSDKDTVATAEDTGYTGNLALIDFTGEALNNKPIVPRSVVVTPATAGIVLHDGGDGYMYTPLGVQAGTIDYFTGAIDLHYPVGSAPNGKLNATYYYQDEALVAGGQRNYGIVAGLIDEPLAIYVACDNKAGARVKVESAATWI